jgi:NTE family protein
MLLYTNINTLLLSGAGVYGMLYLGLLKFIKNKELTITNYYGVSAGSLACLFLILNYTFDEAYYIFEKYDIVNLLKLKPEDIIKINNRYGINNGTKFESLIKHVLEYKDINPYCSLLDLYNLTSKEFYIGVTKLLSSEFILVSHHNYPDIPVWLAIRMSCSIPFVFNPIIDKIYLNDIIVDGGLLNNCPINILIENNIKYHNYIAINLNDESTINSINDISTITDIGFINYFKLIYKKIFTLQYTNNKTYINNILTISTLKYNNIIDNYIVKQEKINIIDSFTNELYELYKQKYKKYESKLDNELNRN